MKGCGRLLAAIALLLVQPCLGQELGQDVDNLTLESPSEILSRLSWTGPRSVDCETVVSYSVFRGTKEDFSASLANRIASGLTKTTYLAKEPVAGKDYYYYVKANVTPVSCALRSGEIGVYPPDLGQTFFVTVGGNTAICTARSTSELSCPSPFPDFHAAIASQAGHDYLIGCGSLDFEMGARTCVNLTPGAYHIGVHSQTLTVWDSGFFEINTKTGKKISSVTPVFSVLARIN
jgi:hypothetical protein